MLTNASFCLKFYRKIAFYSKYCSTQRIALVFAGLPRKKKCKVVFICALNDVHIRPTVGDGNQSRKSLFAIQQMTRATRWHNSRPAMFWTPITARGLDKGQWDLFFFMWLALWELHTLLKLSFFLSAWVSNHFPTNLGRWVVQHRWWVQHPAAVLKEQGSKPIVAPTWVTEYMSRDMRTSMKRFHANLDNRYVVLGMCCYSLNLSDANLGDWECNSL